MALGNEPRFLAYGADALENARPLPVSLDGLSVPVTVVNDGIPDADQTKVFSVDFNAAGDTLVWTPAAGKSIVLVGYSVELSGNASAGLANALQVVQFKAAAAMTMLRHVYFVPTLSSNTPAAFRVQRELQAGYKLAADAVLNVNLSHALTAGRYYVTAFGYEI